MFKRLLALAVVVAVLVLSIPAYAITPVTIVDSNENSVVTTNGVKAANTMTIARKETSQALGSGALAYTTTFAAKTRLKCILFHAASAITQTVTFKFNSKTSSNYDVLLDSVSLVAQQDVVFIPSHEIVLESGDEIDVTCTNSGTPAITVYATVIGETLL